MGNNMITLEDLKFLKIGESIDYHTGDLSNDRVNFKQLDKLANEIYLLSTAHFSSGEFELKQHKICERRYVYSAKRIRKKL